MANTIKKAMQMSIVLLIARSEESNEFTTSLRPGDLLMARKGLKARTSRSTLNKLNIFKSFSNKRLNAMSSRDAITRKKSSPFHELRK